MILPTSRLLLLGTVLLILSSTAASDEKKKRDVECSPFPFATLPHGSIVATGSQKYTFVCHPGHRLTTPRMTRCFKGNWTSTRKPHCKKAGNRCDDPPAIHGGTILGAERKVNSVIMYMCDDGFQLMGQPQRTCLRSTHWSGVTPTCVDQSLAAVSKRLRDKFVVPVASHTSDSLISGRSLDPNSVQNGLELIIMIDRSSSIDPIDLRMGIDFIDLILNVFGVKNVDNKFGTRATVITFGNTADIIFNLDDKRVTSPLAAKAILNEIQPEGGGTAMEEAFMNAFTSLSPLREEAKKAIFMITDGVPNSGTEEGTVFFAKNLREKDFEIFTVGIGPDINLRVLSELASEPTANHVFVLKKYADFKNITRIITQPPKPDPVISPSQCGYTEREEHFFQPWLAALYIGFPNKSNSTDLSFCSGALVCRQWVLTAASCLFRTNHTTEEVVNATKEVFVVMGERDLSEDDLSQHSFYASEVFIHPGFDPLDNTTNNLALLKLNAPASMQKYRPACYPPTDTLVPLHRDLKINSSMSGWGVLPSKTDESEVSGGTVRLHVANSTTFVREEARSCASNPSATLFCATTSTRHCIGNLGSPIIAVHREKNLDLHYLLGVESSRSKCQRGINQFTELTQFLPWIYKVTNHCHREHTVK